MSIKYNPVFIGTVAFIVGFSISSYLNRSDVSRDGSNITIPRIVKSMGVVSVVNFDGKILKYLINSDGIYFYPTENTQPIGFADLKFEKARYPLLFKQGIGEFNSVEISEYEDPVSSKKFVKIANEQPDHGGYSSVYAILIDPVTGGTSEVK